MTRCRICGVGESGRRFVVREMMFGLRDDHEYYECDHCGCIQIRRVPPDLAKYYPPNYHSYQSPSRNGRLKRYLKHRLARHILGAGDLLGAILSLRYGTPVELAWVRRAEARFADPILDVGCGAGQFLHWVHGAGFSNLTGVDPYIERDFIHDSGFRILRRSVQGLDSTYRFILLNHSLEHMDAPAEVLRRVADLLQPDGVALVRLPLAGSHAWRIYGANWVGLDAPRHLFLPTEAGLRELLGRSGLKILDVLHDSTAFQFWGSEQYARDIPLLDKRSYAVNPSAAPFTRKEIEDYKRQAQRLNAASHGDQASFFLSR